jgi:hypothetical protein
MRSRLLSNLLLVGLVAVALAACVDLDRRTDTADEVFLLEVDCTSASPRCQADGYTARVVKLCLVSDRNRPDMVAATVRTSSGAWLLPDAAEGGVATVDLKGTSCGEGVHRELSFVPGRKTGVARVEATVGSFSQTAAFSLESATLGNIELRPALFDLSVARTVALTAKVLALASGGLPSEGGYVTFELTARAPAAASAAILPARVELDATGTATTTLQTSTGITSVTVRATAHGLPVMGGAPASISSELTLSDIP